MCVHLHVSVCLSKQICEQNVSKGLAWIAKRDKRDCKRVWLMIQGGGAETVKHERVLQKELQLFFKVTRVVT